jgi:hypothetical protein
MLTPCWSLPLFSEYDQPGPANASRFLLCQRLATIRRIDTASPSAVAIGSLYGQINAGNVKGAGALLADDFVDHEEIPGFSPTKEGTQQGFQMLRAALRLSGRCGIFGVAQRGQAGGADLVHHITEHDGVRPRSGKDLVDLPSARAREQRLLVSHPLSPRGQRGVRGL